jgi:hypothetical protein
MNSVTAALLTVAFWYCLDSIQGEFHNYFIVFLSAGMGAALVNYFQYRMDRGT